MLLCIILWLSFSKVSSLCLSKCFFREISGAVCRNICPPICVFSSIIVTCTPKLAAIIAAFKPAGPEPIITKSFTNGFIRES
jgi:hypothetical protein